MRFDKDFFSSCIGAVTIVTDDRIIFQGQILRDEKDRKSYKNDNKWEDESDDKCDHKCDHKCDDKCCSPVKVEVEVEAKLEDDPDFIVLRLTCDPAIIRDNAQIQEINPDLFEEGDIIRINVNQIIAVGPSSGCLGDDEEEEED